MHAGPVEAGPVWSQEERPAIVGTIHPVRGHQQSRPVQPVCGSPQPQTYYLGKIEMRGLKVIHVINGIPPKRNCQLPLLLSGVIL